MLYPIDIASCSLQNIVLCVVDIRVWTSCPKETYESSSFCNTCSTTPFICCVHVDLSLEAKTSTQKAQRSELLRKRIS